MKLLAKPEPLEFGAVGAGAVQTGDITWYCTSSVYATLMQLFEAPFSSHLAPAISVRSEPVENERKKTFTGKVVFQNKIFWCHSTVDHYQLSFKVTCISDEKNGHRH
jgi:hypothetical protein